MATDRADRTKPGRSLVVLALRRQRYYRGKAGLYGMYRPCPQGTGGVATALAKDGKETEAFSRLVEIERATERSIISTIQILEKLLANRKNRAGVKGRCSG